jgi:MSHA biogenesis protein MshO
MSSATQGPGLCRRMMPRGAASPHRLHTIARAAGPTARRQSAVAHAARRGFSLLEMLIAISLISVLSVFAAPLLRLPLSAWVDASQRAELQQNAQQVNSALAQDLQSALPGSVRVRTVGGRSLIEMLQVRAHGRHRAGSGGASAGCASCGGAGAADELDTSCADSCFGTLGALEGDAPVPGQDWLVVAAPGTNPYLGGNLAVAGGNKTRLVSVAAAPEGAVLRFNAHRFSALAPTRRFHLVAAPITWDCNPGTRTLSRIVGYPIAAAQPVAAAAFAGASSNVVLANAVNACTLQTTPGSGATQATVLVRVQLQRAGTAGLPAERFEMAAQFALPAAP